MLNSKKLLESVPEKEQEKMFKITKHNIENMPLNSLGILALTERGIDIRKKMSGTTYTKHRALLKAYGFDIHPRILELEKAK